MKKLEIIPNEEWEEILYKLSGQPKSIIDEVLRKGKKKVKVFLARNPKTYYKDTKYHTDANCYIFRRADPAFKFSIEEEKAKEGFSLCKMCRDRKIK